MFSHDRNSLRKNYREAWQKHLSTHPLTPLEQQIVDVLQQHPEYHSAVLTENLEQDFQVKQNQFNPFLHLGMHLAIQEQVSTNRPTGMLACYRKLCRQYGDRHLAEHAMMECLGQILWEAERNQSAPDDTRYLTALRALIKN